MASTAGQLPGCSIPEKCMLHPDQGLAHDTFCENDLKCICKVDNHLGTNRLFSSDCLLKECTDGHGRKSFLRDWLESCRQAGKSGWDDMPWEWEPYLPNEGEVVIRPTTFLNAPPVITSLRAQPSPSVVTTTAAAATSIPVASMSTLVTTTSRNINATATTALSSTPGASPTSEVVSGVTPEITTVPPQPIVVTSLTLSPGAIGGIVAGILVLVVICAGLAYFYWKSNKKAKRKTKEVAILSDRVSGCGFQKYIDELLADSNTDSNSSTGTIIRHPAPTPGVQEMAAGSTSTVEGVKSQSSSVYSMDIARAI